MTAAATLQIDLDLLDELFDNQKKLDDILLFDEEDDFLLSSSVLLNNQQDTLDKETYDANEDLLLNSEDKSFNWKSRNMTSLIVILEIILMYFGLQYFA